MKKLIALLLSLTMLLALAACGDASGTTAAGSSTGGAAAGGGDEAYEIVFIAKNATSNWGQRQGSGITKFNDEFGYRVIYDGPETVDSANQIALVESYIAQQVDAIIVVPFDIKAMEPTLKKAQEAGIVVVTHEASSCEYMDYDVEAVTNTGFGEAGLDLIAEQVGDREGTYVYMVGVFTNGSHNEWAEAAEAHVPAYPNLTLGERVESGESTDGAYSKVVELVKAYPDFLALQVSSAAELPGACNAVEEAGLSGQIVLGGLGIPSQVSQYLESGVLQSCITWDPQNAAYACCVVAMRALKGEAIATGDHVGPGYESVTLDGNVIVGSDINVITNENWASFGF